MGRKKGIPNKNPSKPYKTRKDKGIASGATVFQTPELFFGRLDKGDGCWEWPGAREKSGYGSLSHGGKKKKAHRMAWELVNGPIPEGKLVCHRCDNPPCCPPDHLFIGTQRDNLHDAILKGRLGAKVGDGREIRARNRLLNPPPAPPARAKLTDEQVMDAHGEWVKGYRWGLLNELAAKYGVTAKHMWRLVTGKQRTYLGLTGESAPRNRRKYA